MGVFHGAFLWVAEPGLGADFSLRVRPVHELGTTIKGDRPTGLTGQAFDRFNELSPSRDHVLHDPAGQCITGFVRLFGFLRITVNLLTPSTSEVTFVWPSFCLNSIKSPSQ